MQNCLFIVNGKILFCGVFRGSHRFSGPSGAFIRSLSHNLRPREKPRIPARGTDSERKRAVSRRVRTRRRAPYPSCREGTAPVLHGDSQELCSAFWESKERPRGSRSLLLSWNGKLPGGLPKGIQVRQGAWGRAFVRRDGAGPGSAACRERGPEAPEGFPGGAANADSPRGKFFSAPTRNGPVGYNGSSSSVSESSAAL